MSKLRAFFLIQRSLAYMGVFLLAFWNHWQRPWWQWIAMVVCISWGSWDQWKRPDDPLRLMRRGVFLEALMIIACSALLQDAVLLFLLVSPLARSCIHLKWIDGLVLLAIGVTSAYSFQFVTPAPRWLGWLQAVLMLSVGGYTFVLGELLRQRERLRRLVTVASFDREQQRADQERIRISAQLHDTMGQYWTAVIRALDVAQNADGETRLAFIAKARETAMEGLQTMRSVVHNWHEGRQTPDQWMAFAVESIERLGSVSGIAVHLNASSEVDWRKFDDPMAVGETIARIVIESCTNAIRHGFAKTLWIHWQTDDTGIQAVIRDDGIGKDMLDGGNKEGLGLSTMRNLAQNLGGSLTIRSMAGRGTSVQVRIPYRHSVTPSLTTKGIECV